MNHPIFVFLGALALAAFPFAGNAQEGRAPTWTDVRERVQELHALRMRAISLREECDRKKVSLEERIAQLDEQARGDAKALESEVRTQTALEARLSAATARRALLADHIGAARKKAILVVNGLARTITAGIPFRRSTRLQRMRLAGKKLAGADPAQQAAGLADFFAAAGEEIRLGRAVEFWNAPVPLADGRETHAFLVRLGLAGQMFLSEDAARGGIAPAPGDKPYRELESGPAFEALRDVVAVLRRRKAPRVLPVPLAIPGAGDPAAGKGRR